MSRANEVRRLISDLRDDPVVQREPSILHRLDELERQVTSLYGLREAQDELKRECWFLESSHTLPQVSYSIIPLFKDPGLVPLTDNLEASLLNAPKLPNAAFMKVARTPESLSLFSSGPNGSSYVRLHLRTDGVLAYTDTPLPYDVTNLRINIEVFEEFLPPILSLFSNLLLQHKYEGEALLSIAVTGMSGYTLGSAKRAFDLHTAGPIEPSEVPLVVQREERIDNVAKDIRSFAGHLLLDLCQRFHVRTRGPWIWPS